MFDRSLYLDARRGVLDILLLCRVLDMYLDERMVVLSLYLGERKGVLGEKQPEPYLIIKKETVFIQKAAVILLAS